MEHGSVHPGTTFGKYLIEGAGYADVPNRGVQDDTRLRLPATSFGHLFLIGPQTPRVARVSRMPGVEGYALFVTNDREAAMLKDDAFIDAIAEAYLDAAVSFLS